MLIDVQRLGPKLRRHRAGLTGGVAIIAAIWTVSARAEEQFKLLDAGQIRARVIGKDITDGPHWALYFRSDGTLIGSEGGSSWRGNWKIAKDRLCFTLPSTTQQECNEVWISGANIRMRTGKEQETFDAVVMTHQAK